MGKREDLSDFDKGQIVMARRLGQSISKTADLVGRSRYAVVSTFQKWSKEGQPVNRRQGHGRPRLIDAHGEQKLARLVQSHRRATVAQIAENLNAGHDRKISEHTVHRSLLRMGLRRRTPVRVSMLTPVHHRKQQQWTRESQNWTMEQWKKGEKKKPTKDPSAPKRPPSAFFIFCGEHRPKIKSENPGLSIGDIAKKLVEMWNSISAEVKQPYEKKAAKLKEKHKDIVAYRGKCKPAPATVTKAKKKDDDNGKEKNYENDEEQQDDYE